VGVIPNNDLLSLKADVRPSGVAGRPDVEELGLG
jgi:hypothetical protein